MVKYADLHIHTNLSDGTFTPAHMVYQAHQAGLSCIAITDHDAVCAIEPAIKEAERFKIELIPGVELSAEIDNCEIHILGYFIQWQTEWFRRALEQFRDVRKRRALSIVEKLKGNGVNLNFNEVLQEAGTGAVGRLHIARILQKRGFVHSIQEAFNKYIGQQGPCYVKKFKLTPAETIEMISRLKGLAVLAHPYCIADAEQRIAEFVQLGLRGIEAYYPEHDQATSEHYLNLAKKYGLLVTGGSDCHGLRKDRVMMGDIKISYDLVEKLKQEAEILKSGQKK